MGTDSLKILVACEWSGIVRDAFAKRGHCAISCDLLENTMTGRRFHYQGDVRDILHPGWDMLIAFPPCTALCVSGNGTYADTWEREDAVEFFRLFLDAPIERICVENPVGVISTKIRKPDQYVQPWQFGHGETKKTGLWLKNLPPLVSTNIVEGREQRVWKMRPGPNRGKERGKTYQGIADAMAEQWG